MLVTVMIILMVMTLSAVMISCGQNGDKNADPLKGETVIETNNDGETVIVATDNDGETVIYETNKSGKIKGSNTVSEKFNNQKATAAKATNRAATQVTQTTQAKKMCYITIEGYCSNKAVTLQGDDTAYSILKRSGAAVSAESTQYGLYIKGINGRFAEGSSGWMYSVNGVKPNTSAGNYGIENGDVIKWFWGSV